MPSYIIHVTRMVEEMSWAEVVADTPEDAVKLARRALDGERTDGTSAEIDDDIDTNWSDGSGGDPIEISSITDASGKVVWTPPVVPALNLEALLTAYVELHVGLQDMIAGGRLTEADTPDDFLWLTQALKTIDAARKPVAEPQGVLFDAPV